MRQSVPFAILFALTVCLASAHAADTADTDWRSKIDPQLLAKAPTAEVELLVMLDQQADLSAAGALPTKLAKGTFVYETLSTLAERTQAPILADLEARGVEHRSFWIANMLWVRADALEIERLARRTDVARLHANPRTKFATPKVAPESASAKSPTAVEWNVSHVGADDVWALGIDGSGIVVGGQDTGYDWDHSALKNQYRGWNGATADHDYNWHDAGLLVDSNSPCSPGEPCDDHGHGTHTMGTMVGNDGGSNQIGLAPGARWIGCRNMHFGVGTSASYSACYQWFIAPTDLQDLNPDPAKAPHVINNSWGCPPPPLEDCTDPEILLTVVNNLRAAGIVPVTSAGNSGPSCSSVSDPAAIYDASFTVANTTATDDIASSSSRGPVTVDSSGRMKPDIAAPGTNIRSSLPPNGYDSWSGTSMAGPHVAGLVALLISADPTLAGNVDAIEQLITDSAVLLTAAPSDLCGGDTTSSIPNNVFGWGRIDALAAVSTFFVFREDLESSDLSGWSSTVQ